VVVGQCRSVPQAVSSHDKRMAEHGVKVVQLVSHLGRLPSQRPNEDVPDFVDRQIQQVSIELTRYVRLPESAGLGQLALPLAVEPLDQNGGVDQ
jgi:hypothetical protein